jgi:hypothetical protein
MKAPAGFAAGSTAGEHLAQLFSAVLQYRSESADSAVVPGESRDGAFIGNGDGTATGRLGGTLSWSLWAGSRVYPLVRAGQKTPQGLHLCTMNPIGFIQTPMGRGFTSRGYGLRGLEKYRTSLTLAFGTEDPRYQWLTKVLGVMEGEFDEKAGRATWDVYLPAESLQ